MGLLNLFSSKPAQTLFKLNAGSFTVDRSGRVVVSTLPSSFPAEVVGEIGRTVLNTFREAQTAQVLLTELVIHYTVLKITARELRGGAIIYLAPQALTSPLKP